MQPKRSGSVISDLWTSDPSGTRTHNLSLDRGLLLPLSYEANQQTTVYDISLGNVKSRSIVTLMVSEAREVAQRPKQPVPTGYIEAPVSNLRPG